MKRRRNYTASFKSKVGLEALKGELTLRQIADKYGIDRRLVGKWKKEAASGLTQLFAGNDKVTANHKEIKQLHAKIGQLVIEKDFLASVLEK